MRRLQLILILAALFTGSVDPAWACDGCRVQQSPSFHFSAFVLLFVVPAYCLSLLLVLAVSVLGPAEHRADVRRTLLAGAAMLSGLTLIAFLVPFTFEAFCWLLIHHDLAREWTSTFYLSNRALAGLAIALPVAAGYTGRIPPWSRRRLARAVLILSPLHGFLVYPFVLMFSVSAPWVGAFPVAATLLGACLITAWWTARPGCVPSVLPPWCPLCGTPVASKEDAPCTACDALHHADCLGVSGTCGSATCKNRSTCS